MHGSGKLPWGRGLCTMCDQCRATSFLSHPITGWTLTRLTDAGQSSFCSLAATVSHVAREHWLEVFWILLIGSRHRNAHWDLWNRTTIPACYAHVYPIPNVDCHFGLANNRWNRHISHVWRHYRDVAHVSRNWRNNGDRHRGSLSVTT